MISQNPTWKYVPNVSISIVERVKDDTSKLGVSRTPSRGMRIVGAERVAEMTKIRHLLRITSYPRGKTAQTWYLLAAHAEASLSIRFPFTEA
jgi:hypothetical protein